MSQAGKVDFQNSDPQIPTLFVADVDSAIPIANTLEVLGGPGIETVGSGNILTINLTGGGTAIDSISVDASTAPGTDPVIPDVNGLVTVTGGQILNMGLTNAIRTNSLSANTYTIEIQQAGTDTIANATKNGICHFNLNDFNVDPFTGFVSLSGGGMAIDSVTPDNGIVVVPDANGNIDITASQGVNQANNSLNTTGTLNTLTITLSDGQANTILSHSSIGPRTITTASNNSGLGGNSMPRLTEGNGNVSIGVNSLVQLTTGSNNTAVGSTIGGNLSTGSSNILLGINAGLNLSGSESNNIYLRHPGIASESATIRLGSSSQTSCFIYGVEDVNIGSVAKVITMDSDQLGTATITAGSGVTITPGANTIEIGLTGAGTAIDAVGVDASTGPGTDPVLPDGTGLITVTGAQIANAGLGNAIRTNSLAANTYTIEIQRSGADGTPNTTKNGICHFDSTDFTVDSDGFVSLLGTGALETLTGNSGGARPPTAGNINIVTSGSTATFVGSGSTLTQNFALSNLMLGSAGSSITSATNNASFGNGSMSGITTGTQNAYFGFNCGQANTTSSFNNGLGAQALRSLVSGSGLNVAIGNLALQNLVSGDRNTVLGSACGSAYTGAESRNIIIGYGISGTLGESNVTRIGGNQTACYIDGIASVTTSNSQVVMINSATDQLGGDTTNFNVLSTGVQMKGNNTNTAPPAGFIGEQISSSVTSVAMTSSVAKTITSISLTAGIWDVSGIAMGVNVGSTMGSFAVGISNTNNTFVGSGGIDWFETISTAGHQNLSGSVPCLRRSLSSTTTIYLVGLAEFSSGTCSANGRITATRVG